MKIIPTTHLSRETLRYYNCSLKKKTTRNGFKEHGFANHAPWKTLKSLICPQSKSLNPTNK